MSRFENLIFISVLFGSQLALAKSTAPVLCGKGEKPIFACKKREKTFVLCASNDLSKTSGYLKYKALKSGKIDLEYPKNKIHPKGKFMYSLGTNSVSVVFANGGFNYRLFSDAGTDALIVEKNSNEVAHINCDSISDGIDLSLTATMNLLSKAGLECDAEDCLKN